MTDDKIKDTNKIEDNVLKHTISAEELQEMLGLDECDDSEEYDEEYEDNILPPIIIDLEDYDLEQFQQGIDDTSYTCGVISSLLNTGVSEEFVLTYLINKDTIAYNLESLKMSNDANIEISKNQKLMFEKQEL